MIINKPIYPVEKVKNEKDALYKYFDNIIDKESLSKKDKNYKINLSIVNANIKYLKKELINNKNKYIL